MVLPPEPLAVARVHVSPSNDVISGALHARSAASGFSNEISVQYCQSDLVESTDSPGDCNQHVSRGAPRGIIVIIVRLVLMFPLMQCSEPACVKARQVARMAAVSGRTRVNLLELALP